MVEENDLQRERRGGGGREWFAEREEGWTEGALDVLHIKPFFFFYNASHSYSLPWCCSSVYLIEFDLILLSISTVLTVTVALAVGHRPATAATLTLLPTASFSLTSVALDSRPHQQNSGYVTVMTHGLLQNVWWYVERRVCYRTQSGTQNFRPVRLFWRTKDVLQNLGCVVELRMVCRT